jgi:hypothetical protein
MNGKQHSSIAGTHLCSKIVPRLLLLIALLAVGTACHHRKPRTEQPQIAETPPVSVLNYSCALSAVEGFKNLTVINQATLAEEKDRLVVHATGTDAQLGFSVNPPAAQYAIRLDIESPAATLLELFYQVQNAPFSADHAVRSPLKPGRNQLLIELNDPHFSGGLRLDPGQDAGDYSIYSIEMFSATPVSFVRRPRPQVELAASFDVLSQVLLSSKNNELWGKIKAINDAQLVPGANGLTIKATGIDPALLLPACELSGYPIVKMVLVSPIATTSQVFYKTRDALDYDEAHNVSAALQPGENIIYLEVPIRDASGALRLDPGTAPGDYLLKELEVRAEKAK